MERTGPPAGRPAAIDLRRRRPSPDNANAAPPPPKEGRADGGSGKKCRLLAANHLHSSRWHLILSPTTVAAARAPTRPVLEGRAGLVLHANNHKIMITLGRAAAPATSWREPVAISYGPCSSAYFDGAADGRARPPARLQPRASDQGAQEVALALPKSLNGGQFGACARLLCGRLFKFRPLERRAHSSPLPCRQVKRCGAGRQSRVATASRCQWARAWLGRAQNHC